MKQLNKGGAAQRALQNTVQHRIQNRPTLLQGQGAQPGSVHPLHLQTGEAGETPQSEGRYREKGGGATAGRAQRPPSGRLEKHLPLIQRAPAARTVTQVREKTGRREKMQFI